MAMTAAAARLHVADRGHWQSDQHSEVDCIVSRIGKKRRDAMTLSLPSLPEERTLTTEEELLPSSQLELTDVAMDPSLTLCGQGQSLKSMMDLERICPLPTNSTSL